MTGWHHPLGFLLIIFAGSLLANALTIRWSFLALGQPGPPAVASAISQAFFLGAVVLQQVQSRTGELQERMVIDGQQRLTTLQILFDALHDELRRIDAQAPLYVRKKRRNLS